MVEEPMKIKKKNQFSLDEELAFKLQAELEEEDRLYNQLKNKSFDDIQKLFDKTMKRVNTFVGMDTELVEGSKVKAKGGETRTEGSSKRAREDPQQKSIKKQKVDEDNKTAEL
ncbi:hypothetical protein Tco_1126154 [Tanacetum coccineum]